MTRAARAAVLVVSLAAGGCANPSLRNDELAADLGFTRGLVTGGEFRHVVYRKAGPPAPRPLHVYLEGDGTPWLGGRAPADDPTPRRPLALRLMALDPAPSLLLGRPCYHGLNADRQCGPRLWTYERYSEAVVASMAAALQRAAGEHRSFVLIGYSGGGTLAMLLAERVHGVEAVVTVAANLDVAGWSATHGYQTLAGSLDPATRPPLPRHIRQLHLAGAGDDEVPAALVEAVSRRQHGARFVSVAEFDHRCCWLDTWPRWLQQIESP